ncbi:MAG: sigma-70 family RNA polymerase sigma factor [Stigonema ocellatum SAG 48.90 = DSM 106950]|nr:sigma-70 family RNA polymerase sigma factor [Stigonema ocellatum SAG 48.90 = DSM 106950]
MNYSDRDELDSYLLQLAISAQQNSPRSPGRQTALTKLVNGIVRSGRLCYPQKGQFPSGVYQDIYNEARQELLLYLCENIHKYDADRGSVITWVNVLLDRRFFKDAIRKIQTQQSIKKITLTDLDNLIALPEEPPDLTEILKQCIESDPEDIFKKEHIEKCPQANFQALATRRMSGKTWKEISGEFALKIPTVSSFYYRCVNKFSLKLKEYCGNDLN